MTEPTATYRLQLVPPGAVAPDDPGFGFDDAAAVVDYLAALGISHLYLSPVLQARPGSTHGYDVADPRRVSDDLGGEQALRRLADVAGRRGLELVADIVPNHMGTGPSNPHWEALLAEGREGAAGAIFDVDWEPELPAAAGKVILPLLGDQYGVALHNAELWVVDEGQGPRLRYHEHSFPLSPETVEAIDRSATLEALAGVRGQPDTWTRLHALLEAQHYRLVHWRVGDAVLNYRRFFAINELAAVRVEDEAVFTTTHDRLLALVRDGVLAGLRIDHPDGLRDPRRYLERLRDATGGAWVVVEKILSRTGESEELPEDWPVAGTTGYEFANDTLGLFVDPAGEAVLRSTDVAFSGGGERHAAVAARAKRQVLAEDLAADFRRLVRRLWRLSAGHLHARDVDEATCAAVLADVVVALDVYRTYIDPVTGEGSASDRARIAAACAQAAAAGPLAAPLAAALEDLLIGRGVPEASPERLDFVARLQQLTGAAMAKGVEDTAFYRHRTLLALNEVGGEPDRFGLDVAEFHRLNERRAQRHPLGLLATSTHDTKRSEDVRLRMAAISELASAWDAQVRQWRRLNAALRAGAGPDAPPDPQTEYLVYQTLVGVWPHPTVTPEALEALRPRLRDYVIKASREAGERTTWTDPDKDFEQATARFVDELLDPGRSAEFHRDFGAFARAAAEIGLASSLAQTLLRATSPGVPDTYQGTEVIDDSLVDPDNRRPVDFTGLARRLERLGDAPDASGLWEGRADGDLKLWVLTRALRTRREHPEAFAPGSGYRPLAMTGAHAERIVAFARTPAAGVAPVVTVVPRLLGAVTDGGQAAPLGPVWGDTRVDVASLAAGPWRDVLSGTAHDADTLPVAELFASLPVALLVPS